MPNPNAPSFDDLLQESRRKKNLENLAQQILGRQNRARTPSGPRNQQPSISNSIASRAGVTRRPASIPRTNSAPAARPSARAPPSNTRSNRPAPRQSDLVDDYYSDRNDDRDRDRYTHQQPARQNVANTQSNGRASAREPAVATSFNVRGAAKSDPYIVLAENFAPGTTAADIEAVMLDVGGEMHKCQLLTLNPVVAEMTFVDRQGAETVIDTFDGKKADGRTLHVYWKPSSNNHTARQRSPEAVGFVVDTEPSAVDPADAMDVDEHTRDREEQNRLREERRGAAPRGPANDQPRESRDRGGRPTGPRADRNQYDDRTRYNSNDARYGNGGGGGDRYGNGGGRFRSDGGRGGRGGGGYGQSYRP